MKGLLQTNMRQTIQSFKMTNKHTLLVILLCCIAYYLFAYTTQRTDFFKVFTYYTLLFIGFILIYRYSHLNFRSIIFAGLLFRLILLFAIPNLSDDFYRFLWDGNMFLEGTNPYLVLPQNNGELMANGEALIKGMGSMNASHYTCYPPLNQFAFTIPALFYENGIITSTVILRITLVLSDVVTLFFSLKILDILKLDRRKILLYFINPFIIIELSGNLHYEGMMIAFLAASLYYFLKTRYYLSSMLLAGAISIKLIPLIFLPIFYKKLGIQKFLIYGSIIILINLIFFLPFLNQSLIDNFMSSLTLYFQRFEFNASLYYVIREIGYWTKGYNMIHTIGKISPFLILLLLTLFSFFRNNKDKKVLIVSMLWVISCYYFLSSVVHPWYIAIPLFLSVFTSIKFPLFWSYLVVLSYSAYTHKNYEENMWLVGMEYLFVLGCLSIDLFSNKKLTSTKMKRTKNIESLSNSSTDS